MADGPIIVTLPEEARGIRLDKALAEAVQTPGLSRSRLAALIADGKVSVGGEALAPRAKARGGETVAIDLPPPAPAEPQAQAIPLDVAFEDEHLIVVNKAAGMVVHPAPGAPDGTLVNALLAHCGDSLSGIGGERRPGIVHRIDKDTTGLLVAAKSDAAHQGLAGQFAAHSVKRRYRALLWGFPDRASPRLANLPSVTLEPLTIRVETLIGRSRTDRKKMAVVPRDGRRAVSRFVIGEALGPLTHVTCALETGRTHQIRVHAAHLGHPLLGDATYGRARTPPTGLEWLGEFPRQALHAAELGFEHPVTGEALLFESPLPEDMAAVIRRLRPA